MRSRLRLLLFAIPVPLALSAVFAEQEENSLSLSEGRAEAHRVSRSPGAGAKKRGRRGESGKRKKGKGRNGKVEKGKRRNGKVNKGKGRNGKMKKAEGRNGNMKKGEGRNEEMKKGEGRNEKMKKGGGRIGKLKIRKGRNGKVKKGIGRNGKGKSRKERRGVKKAKGRNRKGKPSKKRKGVKGRKRTNKKAKGNTHPIGKKRNQARTNVSNTCFETAMSYMKIWKDVVGNFERQRKRMTNKNTTAGNKSGKKGLFAPIAHRLVDIGGGNKSNMSCGGQYGNKGAAQLQNLTKTLFNCEKDVNKSCNPANFPKPNLTLINLCKGQVDNFAMKAALCLGKTVGANKTNSSDSCNCWSNPELTKLAETVKSCKIKNESLAFTAVLKKCTSAFQVCRKFEDAASTALSSCASDSSKLKKKAANLAANKASMTAAKTKMSSLAKARSYGAHYSASAKNCMEIISFSQRSKRNI